MTYEKFRIVQNVDNEKEVTLDCIKRLKFACNFVK